MRTYSVYERASGVIDPVRDVVFVKSGFCWPAFAFGFLWFIWHRMWLFLAGYVGVVLVIGLSVGGFGLAPLSGALVQFLLGALLGLEGNNLRRWFLERAEYTERTLVSGRDLEASEIHYFASRKPIIDNDTSILSGRPRTAHLAKSV